MGAPQRPLVGFDGTEPSAAALLHAARLARRNHGLLTVVLVLPPEPWAASPCPLAPVLPPPCDFEQSAVDQLRAAVQDLSTDISVVSLLCRGRVGPTLAREAGNRLCDAIVIGARCGLVSRLTGGVERYLRHHVQMQVMVVKPPSPLGGLATLQLSPGVRAGAASARPA